MLLSTYSKHVTIGIIVHILVYRLQLVLLSTYSKHVTIGIIAHIQSTGYNWCYCPHIVYGSQLVLLQVFMILSGEHDETDTRMLRDKKRKSLKRGGVDAFLMTTPRYQFSVYAAIVVKYCASFTRNLNIPHNAPKVSMYCSLC